MHAGKESASLSEQSGIPLPLAGKGCGPITRCVDIDAPSWARRNGKCAAIAQEGTLQGVNASMTQWLSHPVAQVPERVSPRSLVPPSYSLTH